MRARLRARARSPCTQVIAEATAAVITAQKDWVRERYPRTPPGDLALFPRDEGNKDGTGPIRADAYTNAHRIFADEIAHLLLDADGQQVNPALVVRYAYRHSPSGTPTPGSSPTCCAS